MPGSKQLVLPKPLRLYEPQRQTRGCCHAGSSLIKPGNQASL
jgi:hypothetical protein